MIYSTVFPNAISIYSESKVVMATTKHANFPFCLFSLFLLVTALLIPGSTGTASIPQKQRNLNSPKNLQFQSFREQEYLKRWMKAGSRRLMIGSTAPICTYNECRGCKYRCRAEQIPVDANDPINSAYHYRCVCHR